MRVVIVGAGIAGLSAALRLRDTLGSSPEITLIDQAPLAGGKVRTGPAPDGYLETGAETFLFTDPAAADLAERVGLGDALRHPAPVPAALAVGGRLVPVPRGTVMGIPTDPAAVTDIAGPVSEADQDAGRPLLGTDEDIAVGALVRKRLGERVVDLLVDPLLGGVYAGRADELSLAATVPALAAACRTEHTLTGAARVALAQRTAAGGPVFATIEGGMSRLVDAVIAAARPDLRLGAPVRELRRTGGRWLVGVDGQAIEAEAVVLAVPSRPAARLLTGVCPPAANAIGVLDYASVALVAFAVPDARLPELSGFLVPASEGYAVKALTIFTTKWPHLGRHDGSALLRASVGRYGEAEVLHRSDDELAALVHAELGQLLGRPLPAPTWSRVTRWGGALPQYAPGHLDRVATARAALADLPGIAVAGAAYDGVGIAACVRSGTAAACALTAR